MSILHKVFEKQPDDALISSLGNVTISGVDCPEIKILYFNHLSHLMKNKTTTILVNGRMSVEEHMKLRTFLLPFEADRKVYEFGISCPGTQVDILSSFGSGERKADFVTEILSIVLDLSPEKKASVHMFYRHVILALEEKAAPYSLRDLSLIDEPQAMALIDGSSFSAYEKSFFNTFLEDPKGYLDVALKIRSGWSMLSSLGIVGLFSGTEPIGSVLKRGNVLLLNGMTSDDERNKKLLFNVFLYTLTKCLEAHAAADSVAIVIKKADLISGEYFEDILDLNESYRFAVYFYAENIVKFIQKNGSAAVDKSKAFLVFNQGNREEAEFWSGFFGSRDVPEPSYSYTKKKSLLSLPGVLDGGVVASPGKFNSTTLNVQKVYKPLYRPEEFTQLRNNEVMIYLRTPLRRGKRRIEE